MRSGHLVDDKSQSCEKVGDDMAGSLRADNPEEFRMTDPDTKPVVLVVEDEMVLADARGRHR